MANHPRHCNNPGCQALHHHEHEGTPPTQADLQGEGLDWQRPRRIYVYSPSGAVQDKVAFRRGVRRLQKQGHDVSVDEAALARATRFAGDHASRAAAIHRAAESGADLALISRGGYGINHVLPLLDYDKLAYAIDHGTQFMGFSDFTALQLAIYAKTGRITWAGASLGLDLGASPAPDAITEACFEDVLYGVAEGTGWRIRKDSAAYAGLELANATLWGGNLAVLVSLIGTPYMPHIDGGILFLEDVGEAPYRIERMLVQLEQAGVLARQQAVVLGHFTHARVTPGDRGFKLASVVQALRQRLAIPVLTGLPFGHVATKVCLPFGAAVSLQVSAREALLVWGHL